MSKRNFILLIIGLIIIVGGLFGFLYYRSGTTPGDVINEGTNFLSQFNPFRSNTGSDGDGASIDETPEDNFLTEEEALAVKLRKVSTMPIAGFTVFIKERLKEVPAPEVPLVEPGDEAVPTPVVTKKPTTKVVAPPTEFAEALRYVERSTGNIYQTFADKIEERRFSSTIIPKIYDAYFGSKGQSVVMRHLKSDDYTIETFSGILPKEKLGEDVASNEIVGVFLPDGIKDISLSPDNSKIFYLYNIGESAVGIIMNLIDGKKVQIFNSEFTEWNSFWGAPKTITLTTKPSGNVPGYMYALDTDKKTFINILGNINGLTTQMSPDGKSVLVGNSAVSLYVYNISNKTYTELGIKTLPEKCVWSKDSTDIYCAVPNFIDNALYPDDWYRGEISFSDQIWKINTITGNAEILADPILVPGGEDIDGIKLSIDEKEKYLFFVNKKDSYLWELELDPEI